MGSASTTADKSRDPAKAPERPESAGRRTLGDQIAVRLRWIRSRLTGGLRSLSRSVDHAEVVRDVEADGILSARFVFMTVMSCAIAMLGLLLSSPAVVIGAMLISPLMGPIMLMGFSLCVLDYDEMRRSLISMVVGILAALAISIIIVSASPLREATPEILARVRPNFFDLMVAIFSGLAGGYSVIHRKGATIVGVAIATALMPPLAVVGFGIATWNMVIAGGAFFLFMTNLLAIALSVTALAWLHGFATVQSQGTARFQALLVVVVFAALSVPLGFALRDIAYQARVQNIVREEALKPFGDTEALVAALKVDFPRNEPIQITQTVYTKERVADAQSQLQEHYAALLRAPVELRLNQVAVDQAKPIDEAKVEQLAKSSIAPLQQIIARMDEREQTIDNIRDAITFRTTAIDIDPEAGRASIMASRTNGITLAGFREMEATLDERFPETTVLIVPAIQDLPHLAFVENETNLTEEGLAALETIVWTLNRWEVGKVKITGRAAATTGRTTSFNRRLAQRRADAVAELLAARNIASQAIGGFGGAGQVSAERANGVAQYEIAELVPDLNVPAAQVIPTTADAEVLVAPETEPAAESDSAPIAESEPVPAVDDPED